VEWEWCYLDPNFLNSFPAEIRKLFSETMENILQVSALKAEGDQVASEGLHSLAEAINQIAMISTNPHSARGGAKAPSHARKPKGHGKQLW